MNHKFMDVVFKNNKKLTALVLGIILGKKDIDIAEVNTEETLPNLNYHSIALDIYALDGITSEYNMEIQNKNKGAEEKRARYHSSLLDANMLEKGMDFDNLRDNYVIFITEGDYFKQGKPIYRINRKIEETGEEFNDGEHIIYVNGSDQNNNTELGRLMHDFHTADPNEMNYEEVAEAVRYYKETEEGQKIMRDVFEEVRIEGLEEGKAEGREEGIEQTKTDLAVKAISMGKMTLKEISDFFELPMSTVKKLAEAKAG